LIVFQTTPALAPVALVADRSETSAERLERGLAALAVTSGASGGAVIRSFDDVAPEIGRMIVERAIANG
jgi:4-carboxymuconolactone decarboxylase